MLNNIDGEKIFLYIQCIEKRTVEYFIVALCLISFKECKVCYESRRYPKYFQQHQSIQAKRLNTLLQFNTGQFDESHPSLNIW